MERKEGREEIRNFLMRPSSVTLGCVFLQKNQPHKSPRLGLKSQPRFLLLKSPLGGFRGLPLGNHFLVQYPIKFIFRPAFDPGLVPAVFEENEPEISQNAGKGNPDVF
jgi:hypothetical protein